MQRHQGAKSWTLWRYQRDLSQIFTRRRFLYAQWGKRQRHVRINIITFIFPVSTYSVRLIRKNIRRGVGGGGCVNYNRGPNSPSSTFQWTMIMNALLAYSGSVFFFWWRQTWSYQSMGRWCKLGWKLINRRYFPLGAEIPLFYFTIHVMFVFILFLAVNLIHI